MARVSAMHPRAITRASIALRATQGLLSLVALATVSAAFHVTGLDAFTYRFGSHATNLLLLASYSSMMYAMWYLVCVELYPMVVRPSARVSRAIDAALGFFLLCGATAVAASDYARQCDLYAKQVNCANLTAAATFGFLSVVPAAGALALTFVRSTAETDMFEPPIAYVVEVTPTSASPVCGVAPPTPSSKV